MLITAGRFGTWAMRNLREFLLLVAVDDLQPNARDTGAPVAGDTMGRTFGCDACWLRMDA